VSISGLGFLPRKKVFAHWIAAALVLAVIIFACDDLQSLRMVFRFFVLAGGRMNNTFLFGMIL